MKQKVVPASKVQVIEMTMHPNSSLSERIKRNSLRFKFIMDGRRLHDFIMRDYVTAAAKRN